MKIAALLAITALSCHALVFSQTMSAGPLTPFATPDWPSHREEITKSSYLTKVSADEYSMITKADVMPGVTGYKFDISFGKEPHFDATLYSRAVCAVQTRAEFQATLADIGKRLSEVTKQKEPKVIRRDLRSAVRAGGGVWQGDDATYYLESSINDSTQVPEFATLHVYPGKRMDDILKAAATPLHAVIAKYDGKTHLETKPDGTVWIKDVPMVLQTGSYCVVASVSRVAQLYGVNLDQNVMAEMAKSDPTKGTYYAPLLATLKANGSKLRLRVRDTSTVSPTIIETALKAGASKLKLKVDTKKLNLRQPMFDTLAELGADEMTAFVAGRKLQKNDINQFDRLIRTNIDRGSPVCWNVCLGVVKEPMLTPQAKGGHLRLIIGYDEKARTVTYSDSWGQGHEAKVLPLDDAFAETFGTIVLEPL